VRRKQWLEKHANNKANLLESWKPILANCSINVFNNEPTIILFKSECACRKSHGCS